MDEWRLGGNSPNFVAGIRKEVMKAVGPGASILERYGVVRRTDPGSHSSPWTMACPESVSKR